MWFKQHMSVPSVPAPFQGERGSVILETPPQTTRNPVYRWCWTVKSSLIKQEDLHLALVPRCQNFRYQLEVGDATGYEHYQGQMSLLKKQRMKQVLEWLPKGTHLEETRSEGASLRYCCKEAGRLAGPWEHGLEKSKKTSQTEVAVQRPLWLITELKPWQKEVEDIVKTIPDRRTIHWYWSAEGNLGRTQLCKYLSHHYGAVACQGGKPSDVLDLCTKMKDNLLCAIWNFPRGKREFTLPYELLETIKDGYWFSGKYETGMVNINSPHVMIFANVGPEIDKLSHDRWHIVEIR